MTEDQARIVLLENLLHASASTIDFLHGCLTDPIYQYTYPEQTYLVLEKIESLVGTREYCVHSRFHEDCSGCKRHADTMIKTAEAREVLDGSTS